MPEVLAEKPSRERVYVQSRLRADLFDRLQRYAEDRDLPQSLVIREAIEKLLEANGR